jgi:SSS family solute:Na+ symporter
MHFLDFLVFAFYLLVVLFVGYYFFRKNKDAEDYYVGGRSIPASHVGLSIVATDVGGGFSIGLGGLGFTMGLAGSWLLFTGLIGAWLSAVFIIPRIKKIDVEHGMLTYPDFLRFRYDNRVALLASVISGIGYLGFTGAQVLAGAKLAAATVLPEAPLGLDPLQFALFVIAVVIIGYTVMGGIKAVIYTDSLQWVILLSGLILLAIPMALMKVGGWSGLAQSLPGGHLSLGNIGWPTFVNWMVSIVPIWLVAMTLYQRMYACKDVRDAKRAWFIAGVFEYPVMAFMGVILGMAGRVMFPQVEAEMGLPLLIKTVLPIGVTGVVVAAYFSAIMSTADSCLMASSGNFVNDILQRYFLRAPSEKTLMRYSQAATLIIGALAIIIAASFTTVLDAILYAYGFMVSGLFIPTLGAYFWKRATSAGAFWGMLAGGSFNLAAQIFGLNMPWGLDPTVFGILISGVVFVGISLLWNREEKKPLLHLVP